ncbi:hypothetical protein [Rhodanobacter sp. OR87]|uniref:hypothetical protein n=1 Tax=Rhodanobacter sp. OR87 TaxID=1076523 RepID=UPI00047F9902|nr:hypothetical protein [Rhodanobacter sp. OR87]
MRTGIVFGLFLAVVSSAAHAQYNGVDPYEEFGKRLNAAQQVTPLTSTLFGDNVSLYNGATEFGVTDVDIPGNNVLPVQLRRRLVIEDRRADPGSSLAGFGDWDIDIPYIVATVITQNGWQLNQSSGYSYNRCSDNVDWPNMEVFIPITSSVGDAPYGQVWGGNRMHVPGGGDQELLANTQAASPAYALRQTYPWVTSGNYRVSCMATAQNGLAGEAFVATSPSGVRYTFDWAVTRQAPLLAWQYSTTAKPFAVGRTNVYLLVTRAQDRFGNWVNYSYTGDQLTQITSSDGRTITLTWSGSTITSVTSALGTWSYTYVTGSNGKPQLSAVTRPDGSQWTYAVTSGTLVTTKNDPD